MATSAAATEKKGMRGQRATMVGVVTSNKCAKTITVEYEYSYRHPKYGKYLRRHGRVHAHDENNEAQPGDRVELSFCRPISKTKCWRLTKVLVRKALASELAGVQV